MVFAPKFQESRGPDGLAPQAPQQLKGVVVPQRRRKVLGYLQKVPETEEGAILQSPNPKPFDFKFEASNNVLGRSCRRRRCLPASRHRHL